MHWVCMFFRLDIGERRLARGQGASIDNVGGVFLKLLGSLGERRARKGHEAGAGGLENAEGADQLEERVDTAGLGGPGYGC